MRSVSLSDSILCRPVQTLSATYRQAVFRLAGLVVLLFSLVLVISAPSMAQTETVLYNFCSQANCVDGYEPYANVIKKEKLYGTTSLGGPYANCGGRGCGTAFELQADGKEKILHSFGAGEDGAVPFGGLIEDKNGNLYGTTVYGGVYGFGTVFKISTDGTETILHSFAQDGVDGYWPEAGLIIDTMGTLYGTTIHGGRHDGGTVFEVRVNGKESVLHSFGAGEDGAYPTAALVIDGEGNLYGTTINGGAHSTCNSGFSGCGTVFKVSSRGAETTLHSFVNDGTDGYYPSAGLVMDRKGNLYGTTQAGGLIGNGTVFRIIAESATRAETVLYSFGTNPMDGYSPVSGLVIDEEEDLYGTTPGGGTYGWGVVFEVSSDGTETILHNFNNNKTDGTNPSAGLFRDDKGDLFGTTVLGGSNNGGTVFAVTPK